MKIYLVAAYALLSAALVLPTVSGQPHCIGKKDIGFIVDSSGSIKSDDYVKEKNFVKKVAQRIGISQSGTRAGIVLFSTTAKLEVKLNQYDKTADFNKAVDNLEFLDAGTRIGLALKVALEQLFTRANGMRANVPNIIILLTDGQTSTSDKSLLTRVVRRIRRADIKIIVIGIGPHVSPSELLKIAGTRKHLYLPKTYQELLSKKFIKDIVGISCPGQCTDVPNMVCAGMCRFSDYAKVNCKKTCGYCPAPIEPVAIQFVTERNVLRAAEEKDKFAVQVCGGCLFDGHKAHVALNMQNAKCVEANNEKSWY